MFGARRYDDVVDGQTAPQVAILDPDFIRRIEELSLVRTTDLVLPPDLLERHNRETWSVRSKGLAAWCLAVVMLSVLGILIDLMTLSGPVQMGMIGSRFAIIALYMAAIQCLRQPWAYGCEGAIIIVPTVGSITIAGALAAAMAPEMLTILLTCGLFASCTAVMLARISMRDTIVLACASLAIFAGFILTSPVLALNEKALLLAFYGPATLAVTNARRIQGLIQYRLFILRLSEQIKVQKVSELNARLYALARTDALTEIPNRRFFDDAIGALRGQGAAVEPLSVLLIDIDYFKKLNDVLGHSQGDACLKTVAAALKEELRAEGDFVARFGGEEFVVVLPGVGLGGAAEAADRLRRCVHDLDLPHPASPWRRVTVSIGVAATSLVPVDRLVECADEALYRAKQLGRDRVFIYEALAWTDALEADAA